MSIVEKTCNIHFKINRNIINDMITLKLVLCHVSVMLSIHQINRIYTLKIKMAFLIILMLN